MKVLLLESEPGAARDVEARLRAAAHEVVRCHEAGLPAFPCIGMSDGRCPLDPRPGVDAAVDVAVDVRAHVHPTPAPGEGGAVCAIRRGIPTVATGRTVLHPFGPWLAADVPEDAVVATCESLVPSRR